MLARIAIHVQALADACATAQLVAAGVRRDETFEQRRRVLAAELAGPALQEVERLRSKLSRRRLVPVSKPDCR
ncbi:MAG: hypothetical protein ACFLMY_04960 [Candidatus Brachytrichaceae bacterium NZ_4S206]